MKIKFTLGPYGYEVVLGNISEKIYNKYIQDNDALRDAVTGFEENSDIKEWSDMDDIAHNYGAVLEEEETELELKTFEIPYEQRDHALYIAYGPYVNPRYALSIVVEHGGNGSTTAAPMAKRLFKLIIDRHEMRQSINQKKYLEI